MFSRLFTVFALSVYSTLNLKTMVRQKKTIAEPADRMRADFTSAAIGMSWQLAITVLLTIFGGYKLDMVTGHRPLFTLVGLAVALAASILIVRQALQRMNNFEIGQPADRQVQSVSNNDDEDDE